MKRATAIILAIVFSLFCATTAFSADEGLSNFLRTKTYEPGHFTDVAADAWYADSVKAGYEFGLVAGSTETTYTPDGYMTLAEAITLAARLHSIFYTGSAEFKQGTPWHQVYVDYAVEHGIINPDTYSNNSDTYSTYFEKATRAQFAAIFAAALPGYALQEINSIENESIPDVIGTEEYGSDVYMLYRAGILTGNDDYGTFYPDSYIKRSEVAAIVTRMADSDLRKAFKLKSNTYLPLTEKPIG